MKFFTLLILFLSGNLAHCQDIVFVKDSIMNAYMESGQAKTLFRGEGQSEPVDKRFGPWKFYETVQDFANVMKDGMPIQVPGMFLLYGEGEFKDGKKVGNWKMYTIEDKTFRKIPHKDAFYVDGLAQGDFVIYFPNSAPACKGKLVNSRFDGEINSFYDNGKPYGKRFYKNGKRNGFHQYVYPNGNPELEINFKDDVKHGLRTTYYPNGQIKEQLFYKNGKVQGTYRYFYENGQLWAEKEYKDDLLWNFTKSFDPNGKAVDKGKLENGNGTAKYYDHKGRLYSIMTYKDGVEIKQEDFAADPFSNN